MLTTYQCMKIKSTFVMHRGTPRAVECLLNDSFPGHEALCLRHSAALFNVTCASISRTHTATHATDELALCTAHLWLPATLSECVGNFMPLNISLHIISVKCTASADAYLYTLTLHVCGCI